MMVSFELTKESKSLLEVLYSVYVCRRKQGESRFRAKYFSSVMEIQKTHLEKMIEEDVFELCLELKHACCITGLNADNTLYEISLTDNAIIYGEQTFKRNIAEISSWLSGLKGFLPF
ncbi:MAG: hypothetical protein HFF14_05850 [Angelakisella sp.]|nr:hypothetical protein [Angelakisella sp.]